MFNYLKTKCNGSQPCNCKNCCGEPLISSNNIGYVGPDLECIDIKACDTLSVALQKIDNIICNGGSGTTTTTTSTSSTTTTSTTQIPLSFINGLTENSGVVKLGGELTEEETLIGSVGGTKIQIDNYPDFVDILTRIQSPQNSIVKSEIEQYSGDGFSNTSLRTYSTTENTSFVDMFTNNVVGFEQAHSTNSVSIQLPGSPLDNYVKIVQNIQNIAGEPIRSLAFQIGGLGLILETRMPDVSNTLNGIKYIPLSVDGVFADATGNIVTGGGSQDLQSVIDEGSYAEKDGGNSYVDLLNDYLGSKYFDFSTSNGIFGIGQLSSQLYMDNSNIAIVNTFSNETSRIRILEGNFEVSQQANELGIKTVIKIDRPTVETIIKVPAKTITGDYIINTTPDIIYTVATLPTAILNDMAIVSDATTPTYLGTLVGGGAVVCPVWHNGTNWVSR